LSGKALFFDWAELSLRPPEGMPPEELVALLKEGLASVVTFDQFGRQIGYRHGARGVGFGLSWVCSDPDCGGKVRSWPVHLTITGEGCELLRSKGVDRLLWDLLAWFIAMGVAWKATRLDVTHDGETIPGPIFLDGQRQKLVTRASEVKHLLERHPGLEDLAEGTFYVGKRGSDRALCVYDKQCQVYQEQGLRPSQIAAHLKQGKRRIRWELRLRRALAQAALRDWFQGMAVDTVFRANLEPLLRFQENPKEPNRSRWKASPWWVTFLAGFGPATPVHIGAKYPCSFSAGVDRALRGLRPLVPLLKEGLRGGNKVELAVGLLDAVLGFDDSCPTKKFVSSAHQERQESRLRRWRERYRAKFEARRYSAVAGAWI